MASSDPWNVVRRFEYALGEYTGAPYVVTCRSCTDALLMCLMWEINQRGELVVEIPRYTYVGVAQSVLTAGHRLSLTEELWVGAYTLGNTSIVDSARRLTSGMYKSGTMTCLSFHTTKHLSLSTHGGAVLLSDQKAYEWLQRCRFDGRREGVSAKDDNFCRGIHSYMLPVTAAEGLMRLALLPKHNADLPNSDYADLSLQEIFI